MFYNYNYLQKMSKWNPNHKRLGAALSGYSTNNLEKSSDMPVEEDEEEEIV